VLLVGGIVILIVVTAGMVSTTWVQFIKGSMLVIFCGILTIMIMNRGLNTHPVNAPTYHEPVSVEKLSADYAKAHGQTIVPESGGWVGKNYIRLKEDATGIVSVWRTTRIAGSTLGDPAAIEAQYLTVQEVDVTNADGSTGKKKETIVNGRVQGSKLPEGGVADFYTVGSVARAAGDKAETGPLNPLSFLAAVQDSQIYSWKSESVKDGTQAYTIYYPEKVSGSTMMTPGRSPTYAGIKPSAAAELPGLFGIKKGIWSKLDLVSLMLALFCGTAALPHILIRYYTVKDQAAARKSTVVGIAAIGLFYILTLYLGLGAMTSGMMDPTNNTMAAPLLAKAYGEVIFACISAIAFTTVLGTVSGLIIAASGAIAHDIMHNLFQMDLDDHAKVRAGKIASVGVGIVAILLGIAFETMNPSFLVGWACNIAASGNLPAIVMLLFWKGTTKQGITASIVVGLVSSLTWILLTNDAFKNIYKIDIVAHPSPMPFSQPGLVTIPLSFLTLIVVSLITGHVKNRAQVRGFAEAKV